jgi:hypothetical protein
LRKCIILTNFMGVKVGSFFLSIYTPSVFLPFFNAKTLDNRFDYQAFVGFYTPQYLAIKLPQMMVCMFISKNADLFFRHFTKKVMNEIVI